MNKKDLDALKELYSSVYDEEQLSEKVGTALDAANEFDSQGRPFAAAGLKARAERVARGEDKPKVATSSGKGGQVTLNTAYPSTLDNKPGVTRYQRVPGQSNIVRRYFTQNDSRLDSPIAGKGPQGNQVGSPVKPTPATTPVATRPAAGSSPPRPAARPSGPVLSKKDGVEGTGVGADFKERAFTAAEKSRYSSVAAQNAAKSSAASATPKPSSPTPAASAPKPPTPAVGMLGKTSFERRTPTAAELSGAQGAPAGSTPEQRLQAAQKKTFGAPTTGPSRAIPSASSIVAAGTNSTPRDMDKYPIKPATPGINNPKQPGKPVNSSYEWPSAKTIRDIAGAYASIYEAKKKVDQDEDGDNDFADVRVARMIASGVPKAKAIAMVKDKSYNEEVELWVNELLEEGYDLSEYTWDDMFDIYEATRMGKELGREGEIATRKELERRSNAYQRSGSVDKTIAAAERLADRPYVKPVRGESESDYNQRLQRSSDTMSKLAASRRGSVRDKPRAGLRGYAAKGSDNELHDARRSAMAAGTLTPREKKMLNKEAYETYEFVASYLLENNFANTIEDANVIINNMSEGWFAQIIEDAPMRPEPLWGNKPQVKKEPPMRKEPLWDGPSKPTPTTPTKPQTKKQPPMRDEPLW